MPDITKGKIFTSGETVTASEMNSLVDDAVINSSAITESKIAAGAVTNANKLASGTDGQIPICSATGVPTYVTLSGATVTNAGVVGLDADSVATSNILDANVTTAKIADDAVTAAKMADGTQGDVLIYGASGAPERLGFGTSGQFLKTQGTGANAVWADGGTVNKYSTGWVQAVGGTTVADGATLTVPHALGTSDIIVNVYANDTGSDSGSQHVVNQEWAGSSGFFYGAYVVSPASANVVVQLASQGYTKGSTSGNSPTTTSWTGDYIKIVVMG
jgi:hypothetical protein